MVEGVTLSRRRGGGGLRRHARVGRPVPVPLPTALFANLSAWWSFRQLAGLTINMSDEVEAADNQANPGVYDMDLSAAPPAWEATGLNGGGCAHIQNPEYGLVSGMPNYSGDFASIHMVKQVVASAGGQFWASLGNRLYLQSGAFGEYAGQHHVDGIIDNTSVDTTSTHAFSAAMDGTSGMYIWRDGALLEQNPAFTTALGSGTTFRIGNIGFGSTSDFRVGEVVLCISAGPESASQAEVAAWYTDRVQIEYPGVG